MVEFSPDGVDGAIVPSLIYSANLGRYEEFVRQAKLEVRRMEIKRTKYYFLEEQLL